MQTFKWDNEKLSIYEIFWRYDTVSFSIVFFLMGFERYNNNGLNDIFGYESVHLSTILQIGFNG